MPTKTKTTEDEKVEPAKDAKVDAPWRTGPNVDAGLEPGAVTVDPDTAAGLAARAAREANGATTSMTDDGVEVVEQSDAPYGPKAEPGEEPAVLAHQRGE